MKSSPEKILDQIREIRQMERGKLCPLRDGRYYNHQTWQSGRNVVRYVPADQVPSLQEALANYQRYLELTQAYADLIIQQTRKKRTEHFPKKPSKKHRSKQ
ncbi:MAG: hypothetical protein PHE83_19155 [Opitutaceae bacterium]|nr:hypothetical protein [Opitutaceae bacterium]